MKDFFADSGLETSYLRDLSSKCENIGGINLSQGICDEGTPSIILQEAVKSIESGNNSYVSHFGIDSLRDTIASRTKTRIGVEVSRDEIVVSNGATGAFICTCMALLEKGDEVILLEPFYPYHVITMRAMGIIPKTCKYSDSENTIIDFALVESLITSKTKAILLCSPSNPTGKVLSLSELNEFADLANKHNLHLISDEIYEYITYERSRPHSSALLLRERCKDTVVISGFSKTFAITGWRVGYAIADVSLSRKIALVNDFYYICAPSPFQAALSIACSKIGTATMMDCDHHTHGKGTL